MARRFARVRGVGVAAPQGSADAAAQAVALAGGDADRAALVVQVVGIAHGAPVGGWCCWCWHGSRGGRGPGASCRGWCARGGRGRRRCLCRRLDWSVQPGIQPIRDVRAAAESRASEFPLHFFRCHKCHRCRSLIPCGFGGVETVPRWCRSGATIKCRCHFSASSAPIRRSGWTWYRRGVRPSGVRVVAAVLPLAPRLAKAPAASNAASTRARS